MIDNTRPSITHHLKSWPGSFTATWAGKKLYDLRPADRDYRVGDYLLLQEWRPAHEGQCVWQSPFDEQQTEKVNFQCEICGRRRSQPLPGDYTGRCIMALVTYMTAPGNWGLPTDLCVLGIELLDREPAEE